MDRYIKRSDGVTYFREGKIRPKVLNTDGYYQLKLCKDGKYITARIHRLVAEAFIPNPNHLREINHIDRNRTNNHVENLEWCTHYDNIQHTLKGGNHFCQTNIFGENNPNYGNHILREIYKNNPNLAREKLARPKEQNGRAIEIALYDINHEYIKTFKWIGECAEYLKEKGFTNSTIDAIRSGIGVSVRKNKPYLKHYFEKIA